MKKSIIRSLSILALLGIGMSTLTACEDDNSTDNQNSVRGSDDGDHKQIYNLAGDLFFDTKKTLSMADEINSYALAAYQTKPTDEQQQRQAKFSAAYALMQRAWGTPMYQENVSTEANGKITQTIINDAVDRSDLKNYILTQNKLPTIFAKDSLVLLSSMQAIVPDLKVSDDYKDKLTSGIIAQTKMINQALWRYQALGSSNHIDTKIGSAPDLETILPQAYKPMYEDALRTKRAYSKHGTSNGAYSAQQLIAQGSMIARSQVQQQRNNRAAAASIAAAGAAIAASNAASSSAANSAAAR